MMPASAILQADPQVEILAEHCGRLVANQIEASAEELAHAEVLLEEAWSLLRHSFSAALTASRAHDGVAECTQQLEAAVIAMQCEDAVAQMLRHHRAQTLRLADALRVVVSSFACNTTSLRSLEPDHTLQEMLVLRLSVAESTLEAVKSSPQPVAQRHVVSGCVDLF